MIVTAITTIILLTLPYLRKLYMNNVHNIIDLVLKVFQSNKMSSFEL